MGSLASNPPAQFRPAPVPSSLPDYGLNDNQTKLLEAAIANAFAAAQAQAEAEARLEEEEEEEDEYEEEDQDEQEEEEDDDAAMNNENSVDPPMLECPSVGRVLYLWDRASSREILRIRFTATVLEHTDTER